MINKHLFLFLAISSSMIAMEIDNTKDCHIFIPHTTPEILAKKACVILKTDDQDMQKIFEDLFRYRDTQKISPELYEKREDIIQKVSKSDE